MLTSIVVFLGAAVSFATNIAIHLFDAMGVWGIVFSGISVLLICRFLLGPILGFTVSGASDMVSHTSSRKYSSKSSKE